MLGAIAVAATIPSTAGGSGGSIERGRVPHPHGSDGGEAAAEGGSGGAKSAAQGRERPAADLEPGGSSPWEDPEGELERTRLLE